LQLALDKKKQQKAFPWQQQQGQIQPQASAENETSLS